MTKHEVGGLLWGAGQAWLELHPQAHKTSRIVWEEGGREWKRLRFMT